MGGKPGPCPSKEKFSPFVQGGKTYRRCGNCRVAKLMTTEFFHINHKSIHGLKSWCKDCSNRVVGLWGKKNKQYKNAYDRYRVRDIRWLVVTHYGGPNPKCDCCGDDTYEFLSLDHINGGGTKHRQKNGKGAGLYFWLKKNNYPPGYRVLCYNCNCSLGFHKYCPHKDPTRTILPRRPSRPAGQI